MDRIIGVDRLTAVTLEARYAIEATREEETNADRPLGNQ
jgi:hypothetical protein